MPLLFASHRCSQTLLFGRYGENTVGSDLGHSTSRGLRFEIGDEFVEIDVVANVKADMHHAGKGRAHVVERLGKGGTAAGGLLGVAVLQQLDYHIVELDEANVQTLCAASEVRNPHGAWIDPTRAGLDVLICQQRAVDTLAVEIPVAHHLGSSEHFGVELKCPQICSELSLISFPTFPRP